MIAYLSGKLIEKQANTAIVDVGGVGYEVAIPLTTFYELGEVGADVQLRIYTHVREDAIQLFGFKTLRERDLYLKLISVQGIGPKSGFAMLSGMSFDPRSRPENGRTPRHRAPRQGRRNVRHHAARPCFAFEPAIRCNF